MCIATNGWYHCILGISWNAQCIRYSIDMVRAERASTDVQSKTYSCEATQLYSQDAVIIWPVPDDPPHGAVSQRSTWQSKYSALQILNKGFVIATNAEMLTSIVSLSCLEPGQ